MRRGLCEQQVEPFGDRWMGDDPVAEGERRLHRGLHDSDHLSGLSAEHGEADDRVVVHVDDGLHEAACLGQRSGAQHGGRWQSRNPNGDSALTRLRLAQADTAELRFDKHGIQNQPGVGRAPNGIGKRNGIGLGSTARLP